MRITFAPKGILQIDDARIIHRNFSGVGSKYNKEGERNFSLVIEDGTIGNDPTIKSAEQIKENLMN
mgnify:CR=1 FL=1